MLMYSAICRLHQHTNVDLQLIFSYVKWKFVSHLRNFITLFLSFVYAGGGNNLHRDENVLEVINAYMKPKCHSADSDVVHRLAYLYSVHCFRFLSFMFQWVLLFFILYHNTLVIFFTRLWKLSKLNTQLSYC